MKFFIGNREVELKIDSGADANVINADDWEQIKRQNCKDIREAGKPKEILRDYSNKPIPVRTTFEAEIRTSNASTPAVRARFFVTENRPQAVLGYETATELGVLQIGNRILLLTAGNTTFPVMPIKPVKFAISESVPPKLCVYNNIPAAFEEEIEEYWRDLRNKGIIEPIKGPPQWLSRVEVILKKLGGFRAVIDMRPVNNAIKRMFYPMPNLTRIFNKMKGAKFFSKIDLSSAYFHVPIHKESRKLTGFMTSEGPMQFTRLPFGVNCAPEIFQKIMDETFGNIDGVVVYLDDILIFAPSTQILKEITNQVMHQVKQKNLTINQEKCEWEREKIEFLGMIISAEGFRPGDEKIKAIIDFPTPTTYGQLRGFLGLVTYIAKHMINVSTETAALRILMMGESKLLKGAKKLPYWNIEQDDAFSRLKTMAVNEVITRGFFNDQSETELHTDASQTGISALLIQIDKNKETRVIACASKSLTPTEQAYPQTHREALAIVWGVETYWYHLAGRTFTIVTDHEPMQFIFGGTKSKSNKRAVTRAEGWAIRLSPYRFKVRVVRSEDNLAADTLSRQLPVEQEELEESPEMETNQINGDKIEQIKIDVNNTEGNYEMGKTLKINVVAATVRFNAISANQIKEETANDSELQAVIAALSINKWADDVKRYKPYKDRLQFLEGVLIRETQIVIPRKLQPGMIKRAHESHPGMTITKNLLRASVWWLGMNNHVEQHIKQCLTCIQLSRMGQPEPLTMSKMPDGPWERIALDFWSCGSIEETVLVIADYYSRYLKVIIMRDKSSEATIKQLEKLFQELGWPEVMKHDNGPQFSANAFKQWAAANDVKLDPTTPRDAQENGLVERHMIGVTRAVQIAKVENIPWKETLLEYVNNYNSWPHSVTGVPPRDLLLGRVVKGQLPQLKRKNEAKRTALDDFAREADWRHKTTKKDKTDKKRKAKTSDVQEGDYVHIKRDEKASKIDSNFTKETYLVTSRNGGRLVIQYGNKKLIRKTNFVKKGMRQPNETERVDTEGSSTALSTAEPLPKNKNKEGGEVQPRQARQCIPNLKYIGGQWVRALTKK